MYGVGRQTGEGIATVVSVWVRVRVVRQTTQRNFNCKLVVFSVARVPLYANA